jgi:protein arginine kinase activator
MHQEKNMLCQVCNKRIATVEIINVINGVKTELHLCEQCAKEAALNATQLDLAALIDQLFNIEGTANGSNDTGLICPICGTTLEEFTASGKLGCDKCYETFAEVLEPVIKRLHGTTIHSGKLSGRGGKEVEIKREISDIQKQLYNAVQNEEYELAAQYRDLIKLLKHPESVQGGGADER